MIALLNNIRSFPKSLFDNIMDTISRLDKTFFKLDQRTVPQTIVGDLNVEGYVNSYPTGAFGHNDEIMADQTRSPGEYQYFDGNIAYPFLYNFQNHHEIIVYTGEPSKLFKIFVHIEYSVEDQSLVSFALFKNGNIIRESQTTRVLAYKDQIYSSTIGHVLPLDMHDNIAVQFTTDTDKYRIQIYKLSIIITQFI